MTEYSSLADIYRALPIEEQIAFMQGLDERTKARLKYDWRFYSRPEQRPPEGDWQYWLYLAGRGSGKTRSGAEFVLERVKAGCKRIALVAPTHDDFDKVMVNGDSGILSCCPPWNMPVYNESKKSLTWPCGAKAFGYSAEKPERLRGPNNDAAWCDEIAAWHNNRREETWDMLQFTLRKGENPQCMITTTPIPVPVIQDLVSAAKSGDPSYVITTGSTYANRANLSPKFFSSIITKYEGTRLGKQELDGVLLDDIPGALFKYNDIHANRVERVTSNLSRVVVAVDPSGSDEVDFENNDEIGIVAAGVAAINGVDHYFILEDASVQGGPKTWANQAVSTFIKHQANLIVAEINYGGAMVLNTIKQADAIVKDNLLVPCKKITATRGKTVRAEPISLLYEQGRVHHVGKTEKFAEVEDQLCKFTANGYIGRGSPDRADALVWALSELIGLTTPSVGVLKAKI